MNKIGFVGGLISFFIGSLVLVFTSVIKEIAPKYAYMLFATKGGTYSEDSYLLDFSFANAVAGVLIAVGLLLAMYCFVSERQASKHK